MAKKQKKEPTEAAEADDAAPAAEETAADVTEKKGKKKDAAKKPVAAGSTAGAKRAPSDVFLERIAQHSAYFDNLVDLFPARVYFTDAETGDEGNRFRQKAGERAQAKLAAKENSKKAKRLKLDPEHAKPTSSLVKEGAEQEEARRSRGGADDSDDDDDDEEDEEEDDGDEAPRKRIKGIDRPKPELQWKVSGGGEGREELMARLQKRIEEARAKRNAEEQTKRAQKAQQWRADTLGSPMPGQKTPGMKGKKGGATPGPAATPAAAAATPGAGKAQGGKPQQTPAAGNGAAGNSVQFGRIEGIGKEGRRDKKRKRESTRDPAAALEKIEAAKAEVEAAGGKQTVEGQKLLQRQSWSAALARATGEKVLDDPRLLKKSIKRAEAQKRKSAEAWKERVQQQQQGMEQRQQKRKDNLQGRADEKAAKAAERREKKLMRPGFEGRLGDRALINPARGGTPGMK